MEVERLKTLQSYGVMDTPREKEFDDLALLAREVCNTPIAFISMIDDKRQWFKAKVGIDIYEIIIEDTICQYTLAEDVLVEIPDATRDQRVNDKPKVKESNGIRFYAGIPLKAANGFALGTLSVVGHEPKQLTLEQKNALTLIAKQIMALLEARKRNLELADEVEKRLHTRLKEAQQKHFRLEKEYDLLYKAISKSSGVVEFSTKGIFLDVNKNFEKITGYKKEELLGKHHQVLLEEEDKKLISDFWGALGKGEFKSGRFKRLHKSGKSIWIQASYNPVISENGKVAKVIKIAQNISLEEESREALEKAKLMAENLNTQKDHFIANISHEIRTPINAVLGFTDLLLEQEYSPTKLDYLNSIKSAGDSLLHIVNDILDLSKIETGIFQIDQSPFNLRDTVENVFKMFRLKASQKKIIFSYTFEEGIPYLLSGDKNRLSQVLINLIGNAFKFTANGSITLNVSFQKKGKDKVILKFAVKDTGIGIPENKLDTIFHRFSQADEHTSKTYGGTGLGLNICKLLLEKQGGAIEVDSSMGEGSIFTFTLPFKVLDTPVPEYARTSHPSIEEPIPLNILLFEDNILNQKLMEAFFAKTEHELDIAVNGEEGLKLLSGKKYDLILMDIQMPILDGYQTTKIIREEVDKDIPIIALTAHSLLAEREKCLSQGMNDYLSKPISKKELLEKIAFWSERVGKVSEKSDSVSSRRFISLNQLIELTQGDEAFQKEMMEVFIKQTEDTLKKISENLSEGKLEVIGSMAHKLKTSFGIFEASTKHLAQIEYKAKAGGPLEDIAQSLDALHLQVNSIYKEFDEVLHRISE
jgi:PAS domain S-box-containing protein